jgi:hypothetical protein
MVRYASSRIGFLLLLLGAAADDADGGEDDAMMGVSVLSCGGEKRDEGGIGHPGRRSDLQHFLVIVKTTERNENDQKDPFCNEQ